MLGVLSRTKKLEGNRCVFQSVWHIVLFGRHRKVENSLDSFYERCLLYFENKEKKTKIYHRKWLYYFSKYSPWRSIHFFMHLNQFSKHFFHSDWGISKTCILNALTASTGVEKRWSRNFFFICGIKNKSLGAK